MIEIKLLFAKRGLMKYIGHLDLVRLFPRALRRAGIPIALTQGFTPRPKMKFNRALKLGVESEHEELTLFLKERMNIDEVIERFQLELPEGIKIAVSCK